MNLKNFGILLLLLISNLAQAQLIERIKSRSDGDPANPTSLFTRYDSHFELSVDSKTYLVGNLWSLAFAFSNKYQVNANAPLAFSGQSNKFGLGDTEIGFSSMPLLDSTSFLSALGYSLQVTIPTGNYNHNLGIGSARLTPSVIANFKFSDRFYLLPELKYFYTSKILQTVPDTITNNNMHGLDASLKVVFKPTGNSWIWVTPAITTFDLSGPSTDFELEVLYGIKLLNRVGLTAYIRNNFTADIFVFRFTNSIFF